MDVKKLFTDDDAVSPVIGVILMVAITVILAAVIASFVLGLGNNATNTSPQASFGFDYDSNSSISPADGNLTISHEGGDSIKAEELYIRGDFGDSSSSSNDIADSSSWSNYDDTSESISAKTTSGDDSRVVSGDRLVMGVGSDYDLDIVYQSREGDSSSTLAENSGPDA